MEIVKRIDEATAYDDPGDACRVADYAQGSIPYLDTRILMMPKMYYVIVALDADTGEELGYIRE